MSPENALVGPRRGRLRQVGWDLGEGDGAAELNPATAVVGTESQADVPEADKVWIYLKFHFKKSLERKTYL